MNLQINFLSDSEIRSGSNVGRKFVVGMSAFTAFFIILFVVLLLAFSLRQARIDLVAAREEITRITPVHDVVVEMRENLEFYRRLLHELDGWRESRVDWYGIFTALQSITPQNAQLTRMMVNERFDQEDGVPARKILMLLTGKVVGTKAREDIQRFDRDMRENPVFASLMSGVEVRLLGAAEGLEDADARLFDITCSFASRKMGERRRAMRR